MTTSTKTRTKIVYVLNVTDPSDWRTNKRYRFTSKAAREQARKRAEAFGFVTTVADVERVIR